MRKDESNNQGRGFWFEFEDGYHGWALCMNEAEQRQEEKEHGKRIKWIPA